LIVAGALQDEQGEEGGSIYSSSPRAMLPSAAQPLSVRGRARYVGTDSMEGLQEAPLTQVCCPLTSTDPQVSYTLVVIISVCCVSNVEMLGIRLMFLAGSLCHASLRQEKSRGLKLHIEECPILTSRPDRSDCLHHPDGILKHFSSMLHALIQHTLV